MIKKEIELKAIYSCKICYKNFKKNQLNHLVEGYFLCNACLKRDNELRKKHNLPLNKLMLIVRNNK